MDKKSKIINLDSGAGTRLLPESLEAMLPYLTGEKYFNPSAPYIQALDVQRDYEDAKNCLAHTIGARGDNLVITSSATEANNLAFTAINNLTDAEVLISPFEHPSIREIPVKNKKIIKADLNGIINLQDLKNQITPNTALISVGIVASDLGTIQPLSEIAEIVREERQNRLKNNNPMPILLHSDASQGFEVLEVNVARFGVDLMTLNSGKMHGPKGVGALFVKPASGIKLSPLVFGGGQEKGLKSGTENVAGAIGFANSAEYLARHRKKHFKNITTFKTNLKNNLKEAFGDKISFVGSEKKQLVNFLPVVFKGYDAERLIFTLENHGVLASTGSACAANKGQKSESLQAIGLTDKEINGSLRLSFSFENTPDQIPQVIEAFKQAVVDSNKN